MHVGYGVRCRVTSGYDWTDICQPWGERPVLLRCLAVSADASSNQMCRRMLFIHKTIMLLTAKLVVFLCSVISQGKVVAVDRWGGKWNHLSITHRLTTDYAKNYCNRALILKVIVENVVKCFYWDTVYLSYTWVVNYPGRLQSDHATLSIIHMQQKRIQTQCFQLWHRQI